VSGRRTLSALRWCRQTLAPIVLALVLVEHRSPDRGGARLLGRRVSLLYLDTCCIIYLIEELVP
jgi:hypothetical protein